MLRALLRSVRASCRRRDCHLPGIAACALMAWAVLAMPSEVTAFERLGAITLESGETEPVPAVIDPTGAFAYFGTFTKPGRVVKIDLETFERVDAITLDSGEDLLRSAVIDPAGAFAYFGTETFPGQVVKIDLKTFERVGVITLDSGEDALISAVIDPTGAFAYFGMNTEPGQLVKVDLETFQRVDAITLDSDERDIHSAVIDPTGAFAYFGADTFPGRVVKIDLETFERVGAITLDSDEAFLYSAVIDPTGAFAYFGTYAGPGRVVKVDLETFERVDAITLGSGEDDLASAVMDPTGAFAYFGTDTAPGRVVKVDLETFERIDAITLDSGEIDLLAAVIDPTGVFAYFGTDTNPGRVVKIGLKAFSPVGLAVDFEPLASDGNSVFEPGEQVEAAPTWRNESSSDVSVDGILSDFVGPDGASYDIVEGGVGYGPVPPGETASCRDSGTACYQLEVQMTGPDRPAQHWDATVAEALDTGSEDIVHTWTLHFGDSFADVPRASLFYSWIETLLHAGVTGGCGETEYCPAGTSTRGQMPAFVLRALLGAELTPEPCVAGQELFDDVPASHLFCSWIEELAERGVVAGCGDGNYCPNNPVTRAQMAIFLLRTLEGADFTPPECTGVFADVDCPSIFADWVEELFHRGVTGGCGDAPLRYCPSAPNTRGQMAVFLSKTFGLTLYGP